MTRRSWWTGGRASGAVKGGESYEDQKVGAKKMNLTTRSPLLVVRLEMVTSD